mgnify:FL=1
MKIPGVFISQVHFALGAPAFQNHYVSTLEIPLLHYVRYDSNFAVSFFQGFSILLLFCSASVCRVIAALKGQIFIILGIE